MAQAGKQQRPPATGSTKRSCSKSLLKVASTPAIRRVLAEALDQWESRAEERRAGQAGAVPTSDASCPTADRVLHADVALERLAGQRKVLEDLSQGSDGEGVPYHVLRDACTLVREGNRKERKQRRREDGPWVHELIKESSLQLPSPPIRKRSPEFEAHMAKLREDLETKEYKALLKDVDGATGKEDEDPFMPTFREQAAFGLNVVTIMATGYIVGHAAMAALDRNNVQWHPVGGLVGLVIGMMVEVILFIIIAARHEAKQAKKKEKKPWQSARSGGSPQVFDLRGSGVGPSKMNVKSAETGGPGGNDLRRRKLGVKK